MKYKFRVAILCGGKSSEHEISLCSAWNLVKAIDQEKFEVVLIGIDHDGNWFLQDTAEFLKQEAFAGTIKLPETSNQLAIAPGNSSSRFFNVKDGTALKEIDVIFPMIHGPFCEDGSMQGLLKQIQLPFIGPGVLSSAICMDKDIAKRLMQHAGIPTSDFLSYYQWELNDINYESAVAKLKSPLFIKPANMGSSVGISKVSNEAEFKPALEEAFKYDTKIVIEQFIKGREIECAILGNEDALSSVPGQYVYSDEFFTYDTKYLKGNEVQMEIPAHDLDTAQIEKIKELAIKTYKCLQCEGLARVDIFLSEDGSLNVNEVNTLPGFTNSSMYPGLMNSAGINYTDLITRLIELAIDRFGRTTK